MGIKMNVLFRLTICIAFCILSGDRIRAQTPEGAKNDNEAGLIADLIQRIEVLEAKDIKHTNQELEYKTELTELRKELKVQEEATDALLAKSANQQREIDKLNEKLKATRKEENVQVRNDAYLPRLGNMQEKTYMNRGPSPPGRSRRASGRDVAFFAKLVKTPVHLDPNATIKFEVVEANDGGAYDSQSGTFVAPVSGTYVFSVTITTFSIFDTHCGFSKNGKRLTEVWMSGRQHAYDSSGQTILLHLDRGDVITVQQEGEEAYLEGHGHSLFSGFLLYEDGNRTPEPEVAFFAKLAALAVHLAPNDTVVFDVIETNVGGAYDSSTGFFVAPVTGTYVFSITITTFSIYNTDCGFAKNHERLTQVFINGRAQSFDTSGQTILLHLHHGDMISVQQAGGSESYLEGHGHSLFVGFLLYADQSR